MRPLRGLAFPPDHVVALRGTERLTWERFQAEVGGTARQLAGCRRAALLCQDSWRFAVGLFGLLSAGATVVLPPNAQPATLAALAGDLDRVVDDDFIPAGADWSQPPEAESLSLHFHTSGSTGGSKRIERGLGQMDTEIAALQSLWGEALADAPTLSTVPHQHVYGLVFKLLWPLAAGRPFVTRQHDLWEDLRAELPEGAVLVTSPAHLTRLGGLVPLPATRRPRMVLSAGAPLPEAAAAETRHLLGVAVTEIYGSTETGCIATRPRDGAEHAWMPLPGYGVSASESGLMRLAAPGLSAELADRIEPVAGGGFHLRGRADRVAKIEGKRIGLDEVERALAALSQVEAAAVVVLDRQVLAAVVVLSPEGRADLAERGGFRFSRTLRQGLAACLEPAGLPRRWRFVDALPSGAMGKRKAGDLAALFEGGRVPLIRQSRAVGVAAMELDLEITQDLLWFRGHFPDAPILPGVVQLHWAVDFARTHLGLDLPAAREFQIKFKAVIIPGDAVTLALRHDAAKGRLGFEYRRGDTVCSIGTVFLT